MTAKVDVDCAVVVAAAVIVMILVDDADDEDEVNEDETEDAQRLEQVEASTLHDDEEGQELVVDFVEQDAVIIADRGVQCVLKDAVVVSGDNNDDDSAGAVRRPLLVLGGTSVQFHEDLLAVT